MRTPANCQIFFEIIIEALTFQIVDPTFFTSNVLRVEQTDDVFTPLTQQTLELGFTDLDFISNMGLSFYYIFIYIIGILVYFAFYPLRSLYFVRISRLFFARNLIHGYILRYFLENYIEIGVCCAITIFQLINYL